ncbi:hypothetical protein KEJ33_05235 [Candidatus Bathyarchaeota archaeon]|nr:hypothetical protein [Candidatus Bathyarchaeota archaeon]
MIIQGIVLSVLRMIVVPYIEKEPDREKPFTNEIERAAILCLSEIRRKKPILLRSVDEKIEYIAKLYYPLWAAPNRGKCVLVDGLGLASINILYNKIPSILSFTENLIKSNSSFSLFKRTLIEYENFFKNFSLTENIELKAVLSGSFIPQTFISLINLSSNQEKMCEEEVVKVFNGIDEAEVEKIADRCLLERQKIQRDSDGLHYAMKILKRETDHHLEKISIEIKKINEKFETKISELSKEVNAKINHLHREKQKEIDKIEKQITKENQRFFVENRKLSDRISELKRSLRITQTQKGVQKQKYPKRSTTRIDNKISLLQEKLDQMNSELERLSSMHEKALTRSRKEVRQLEERYQILIDNEKEKLNLLEKSRDIELSRKKEEIDEIESLSQKIETQINNLLSLKLRDLQKFDDVVLLKVEINEPLLVLIPFYVVQYRLKEKTRIDFYPPMTVASYEGILKKIQKTLFSFSLESRMNLLMSPQVSNLYSSIFSNLKKNLKTEPFLKEQIVNLSFSVNLLKQPKFMDDVFDGLAELESEGWLNPKEKENIIKSIPREQYGN